MTSRSRSDPPSAKRGHACCLTVIHWTLRCQLDLLNMKAPVRMQIQAWLGHKGTQSFEN